MNTDNDTLNAVPNPGPLPNGGFSPFGQVALLFALTCIGTVLGGLLSIVPFLVKGISFRLLPLAISDPANAGAMRLAQVLSTVAMFGIPSWLFARNIRRQPKHYFYFDTVSPQSLWLLVFLLAVSALPVSDFFSELNQAIPVSPRLATYFKQLEANYNKEVMAIMQMKGPLDLLVSLFIIAFLPAVLEELFFRGALQQVLAGWLRSPFWGILLTSVIFSAIHGSFYGFLSRLFLGLLLGVVFYLGKNIKLNMLIHFLNNGISVVSMCLLMQQHKLTEKTMNETLPWYIQATGIVIFAVVFYFFYTFIKKEGKGKQHNNGQLV